MLNIFQEKIIFFFQKIPFFEWKPLRVCLIVHFTKRRKQIAMSSKWSKTVWWFETGRNRHEMHPNNGLNQENEAELCYVLAYWHNNE